MTQVITFGNFKGGVGKTSNSTMVALELSNRDFKTLLVDLDPQGNATNLYLKTKLNISNEDLLSVIEDLDSAGFKYV